MKISVVSGILGDYTLDESLKYLSSLGVDQFELGVGGYPGKAHADALVLSKDKKAREELLDTFKRYNMGISALAVHGNCVHPDKATAEKFEADFEAACVLAGQLGVDRLVTFSGCPGSDPDAKEPSWVTCAWPPDYPRVLEWQWNEVLIPYWKKAVKFAADNGVKKIALELHPGFCVYNPATLLRLRSAAGDMVGANIDPSHLFWQGMDILEVIRDLGAANAIRISMRRIQLIEHIRKRRFGHQIVYRRGGRVVVPYPRLRARYQALETDILRAEGGGLRRFDLDRARGLMSPKEGLEKAVRLVKESIITENNGNSGGRKS
ncbi:MAG: sugar phosphate isomerase/epimerase family protein [Christensenellaceae bacterium]